PESFSGGSPLAVCEWRRRCHHIIWCEGGAPGRTEEHAAPDPALSLGELLAAFRPEPPPGLPRFFGGAVGYFGYDVVRAFERLPSRAPDDLNVPECEFVITDTLIIFDNLHQTLKIVANAQVRP